MLKRTKTIALLVTILIALMTIASSCFDFIKPGRGFDAIDLVDEMIDESEQDGQPADEKDTDEGPKGWYQPQVPYIELFDNSGLRPLDWFAHRLYPVATNDDRAKVVFTIDPNTGKLIYSIEGQDPGLYLPQVDQVGWGYMLLTYNQSWSGPPPDVVFPCDQDINILPPGQDWFTICPNGAQASSGGSWHVVYNVFDAPIPWGDPNYAYTYAAVFDGDGLSDNNFQFMDPYNWDYWQNSDQWYILDWMQEPQTWTVSVMGENWEQVESNSRAVIHDNAIFWIIPDGEFAIPNPGVRVSSFATPGGWDAADVGGDVNGDDPTEPLTLLDSDPIHVMDPVYAVAGVVLDDDWEICGSGQCTYNEKIVEAQKTEVWCTDAGCSGVGGECSLFSRGKEDSPQDPESWSYVAGSNEKMQKDWNLAYHCFCVK
jgi:hypothetical protein